MRDGVSIYNPILKGWKEFGITETQNLSPLYSYIEERLNAGETVEARCFGCRDAVIWCCVPIVSGGEESYSLKCAFGETEPAPLAVIAALRLVDLALTKTNESIVRPFLQVHGRQP